MPPTRRTEATHEEDEPVTMAEFRDLMTLNSAMMKTIENLSQARAAAGIVSKDIAEHSPKHFDGSGGPAKLEDWLREMNKVFVTVGCPNDLKVDQAAFYLSGAADLWWNANQEALREEHEEHFGEGTILGWDQFKKEIRREFFPEHLRKSKRAEFNELKQGNSTVEEYYHKFMELSVFVAEERMSAKTLAARFEDGLHIDIVEKMRTGDPTTIRQVYVDAGHAERVLNRRKAVTGEKRQAEQSDGNNRFRKKSNFNRDQ